MRITKTLRGITIAWAGVWVISSYSSGSGACVEVKRTPTVVAVRDSKDPSGGR